MDTLSSMKRNVVKESGRLLSQRKPTREQPSMDDEQLANLADDVYTKVALRIVRDDDVDAGVPEYVACRLIDAIEWASPHYAFTKRIAELVVEGGELLSNDAKSLIRKHFDLGN